MPASCRKPSPIQAVQQFIAKSVPPNEFPPVFESTQSADGYSGDRYDIIARKFQQATLDPKLMAADSNGGGGGSGGSGGGSSGQSKNSDLRSA